MMFFTALAWAEGPLRCLIFSGQNNHDWRETTPLLKQILEGDGGFAVEIVERPDLLDPSSLEGVDVILSNWNTFGKHAAVNAWPQPLENAVLDHVREGGGFVVVHAGGTSFPAWSDFQEMIGATWGAGTGHGLVHRFKVAVVDPNHPITRGLDDFQTTDELWHRMVVNGPIHVLAQAFSDPREGGTGRDEPVAFVTRYGEGRCFNLVLGHDAAAMSSPGFQTLLKRGVRWAGGDRTADP